MLSCFCPHYDIISYDAHSLYSFRIPLLVSKAPAASLRSGLVSVPLPRAQQKWLLPSPQPSAAAGGWLSRQSSKTCSSLLCCWAGRPCSSCWSLRASTLTCAKHQVRLPLLSFMTRGILPSNATFGSNHTSTCHRVWLFVDALLIYSILIATRLFSSTVF